MILRDMGATVLIIGLLLGGHFLAKNYSPEYAAAYQNVKAKAQPYFDKAKQFETDYIDPYRTPTDGIDNPVWQPKD